MKAAAVVFDDASAPKPGRGTFSAVHLGAQRIFAGPGGPAQPRRLADLTGEDRGRASGFDRQGGTRPAEPIANRKASQVAARWLESHDPARNLSSDGPGSVEAALTFRPRRVAFVARRGTSGAVCLRSEPSPSRHG